MQVVHDYEYTLDDLAVVCHVHMQVGTAIPSTVADDQVIAQPSNGKLFPDPVLRRLSPGRLLPSTRMRVAVPRP